MYKRNPYLKREDKERKTYRNGGEDRLKHINIVFLRLPLLRSKTCVTHTHVSICKWTHNRVRQLNNLHVISKLEISSELLMVKTAI